MRIGIDARFYGPRVGGGGIGRYVQELITHLQKIPTKHQYILFLKKENFHECIITNPHFEKRMADAHWYGLAEQRLMPRLIREARVDLMHYPHWNIPVFARVPFVVTIHDLILLEDQHSARSSTNNRFLHGFKYAIFRTVLEIAIHSSKSIISVSDYTKQSILKHFGLKASKIQVIHNGLTLPAKSRTVDLRQLGVLEPYFLYVGNAYPHKNLEMMLHAFALLCKLDPYVQLVIAGRRDAFSRALEKEAREIQIPMERLRFIDLPTDEELAALYQKAHLFIFPSRIEGFGIPPLEALAYGIPVAAARSSSLPEVLGEHASYFDPDDIEELVRTMRKAIHAPASIKPSALTVKQHLANFDWNKAAQRTVEVYESALLKR